MPRKSIGKTAASLRQSSISGGDPIRTTNPVEQLQVLRSFVDGSDGTNTYMYSESDLLDCLKQCGYNVSRAAEILMTGQYQQPRQHRRPVSSDGNETPHPHPRRSAVGGKSAFHKVAMKASPLQKKKEQHQPYTSSTETTQTMKPSSISSTCSTTVSGKRKPSVPSSPTDTHCSTTTPKASSGSSSSSSNNSRYMTPAATGEMFDLTKENDIGPTQQHIPAVSSAAASSCLHSASLGGPHYGTPLLLLCRRWMSDAVVTSRRGRVRYQENLPLSHSWTGYGMVRFATRSVEGRLPENLAAVLAPLLRYDCHSKTTHDRNSSSSTIVDKNEHVPLIHVRADALMQDDALVMGSTLPVQVTVYIASPQTFFELMAPVEDDEPSGSASQYFASTKSSTSNNNSLLRQQQGLRHSKNMPLADAAYLLLQWAEYGDVPDFKIPPPPPPPPTGVVDSSSSVEVSTPPPTKAGPKIVKSEKGSKGKNDDETEHFCDGDVDSLLELNEDEYEAESVDGSTDQGKELDGAVQVDNNHAKIPEADDPIGFADHVTLRPYQKQALYFMIERETVGDNREQLEAQLQLLNKLSSAEQKLWSSSSMSSNAFSGKGSKHGIVCDCGPVLVSEASKKQSITLDGKIDPVNHPLWKRRFLALPDMTSCISFYVNELVGVATHKAPEPPRPCSGGILADAMGLGKTVMLMALILQSKVERAVAAKPVNDDANQCVQSPTTTLVVAKMSLLAQWEEEIRSKTNLTYKIYYGQSGKAMSVDDLNDVDVVITTYGTAQGELRRKYPVLLQCHWLRVILDEAHCIRNQRTLASRVCCSLKAEHRWCVSGTIIQNSLDDVFGIMKFLKHEPWCFPSFWKSAITVPAKAKITDDELDPKLDEENLQKALGRVRRVLGPLMLRRTKDSVSKDGEPILKLPPVERKTVFVKMSETEREFYNAVLARSMQVFDGFVEAGIASKAYIQILSMLTRLRQVCDHISLTVKSHIDDEEWMASVAKDSPEDDDTDIKEPANSSDSDGLGKQFLEGLLKKFYDRQQSPRKDLKRSAEESDLPPKQKKMDYVSKIALAVTKAVQDNCSHIEEECAICLEHPKIDDAVLTPCAHIFCRDCLLQTLRAQATGNYDTIAKPTLTGTSLLKCPDGKCPTCQGKVKAKNIIAMSKSRRNGGEAITSTYLTKPSAVPAIKQEVRETQEGNPFAMARQILENAVSGTESSKLNAVINELMLVWTQDPGSKVLIFSHFLGFLDLLGNQLHNDGITFFRLDGSLNLKERMNVLEQFRSDQQHGSDNDSASSSVKKGTVLLMSMGAGGEGLNITSASSCFIIEPWWNSAKEDQCVNRIHRFGQLAETVRVRKFIVSDSVEERIVELQKKKAYVADEIYSDKGGGGSGEIGSTRLGMDDLRQIFHAHTHQPGNPPTTNDTESRET